MGSCCEKHEKAHEKGYRTANSILWRIPHSHQSNRSSFELKAFVSVIAWSQLPYCDHTCSFSCRRHHAIAATKWNTGHKHKAQDIASSRNFMMVFGSLGKEIIWQKRWFANVPELRMGDLVLLAEGNDSHMQWKLGRIIETYNGNDIVRVCKVKTASSDLIRPVVKLRKLPIDSRREARPDPSQAVGQNDC